MVYHDEIAFASENHTLALENDTLLTNTFMRVELPGKARFKQSHKTLSEQRYKTDSKMIATETG